MNNPLADIHRREGVDLVNKNGISVPLSYGFPDDEYTALRHTAVILDYSHYTKVVISGSDAFDFVDGIITGRLGEVYDENALYSLVLDEAGGIRTDCYVLNNDEKFIILAEHIDEQQFMELLEGVRANDNVTFASMACSHSLIVCEGPYSWELVKECFGMDIVGIPYLGFMTTYDGIVIFRCGKSGEFCYKLLVPFPHTVRVWELLIQKGVAFNARKAGLSLQEITRLENPFWNPSAIGGFTKNPIELQLQWAIRYDKEEFWGRESLKFMMSRGCGHKVVGARFDGSENDISKVERGDRIFYRDNEIGHVINTGYSAFSPQPGHIALVRLLTEYAYAGIESYEVRPEHGDRVALNTCSTPFLVTKSFFIDPHVHSYLDGNKPKDYAEGLVAER